MSSKGDGPGGGKPIGPDDGNPEQIEQVSQQASGAGRPEETGGAQADRPAFEEPEGQQAAASAEPGGMPSEPGVGPGKPGTGKLGPGKPGLLGKKSKKPKKQRSRLVRYSRRVAFGLLGFIGFAILAFGVAYLLTPVPSPQEDATAQGPEYYYSDGKTLIAKRGVNREAVDLDTVPKHVQKAVIAAENRSFYDDPGVSVRGTARAFWSTVSGEQLQGGSTITQQMVRNYYQGLGQERTVTRKLKEIMVSLKVGSEKDKGWILEQYLNTIYFGRDAYGIQAAAHAYYGKDVKQLTPAESAYLAAAIQQPTPFGNPTGRNRTATEQRWRDVVTAMTQTGAITPAEAAALKFPKPIKQAETNVLQGQIGYMVNVARKELRERRGYSEDTINRGGLKITTTFDKKLMDAAKDAVNSNLPSGVKKSIRTGLVSVDPSTGQVVAFYGGRNFLVDELSSAFGDWAQAASGFKPIVLATALADGKELTSTVDGSSPQYFGGHPVSNDSDASFGEINLVNATQNSVNTAYVNLGQEVGLDKVTAMAEKMGIPKTQLTANGANTAPTFPLGVISIHPVQQAGVFATFAAEGMHRTPYTVKSVVDGDGDKKKFTEKGKRAFSQQVARDATYAMTKVVQSGTGTRAQLPDGRDVAGKTGTADKGGAIWFNGFIPQLATSVGIFNSGDSSGKPVVLPGQASYGGIVPADIWRSYMSQAVDIRDIPAKEFGSPSAYTGGGGGDYVDRPTDRPSDSSTPRPGGTPTPTRPSRPDPTGTPGGPGPGPGPSPGKPTSKPPTHHTPPPPGNGGGNGGDPRQKGLSNHQALYSEPRLRRD